MEMSEGHQKFSINALHPVGLFCQDIDNHLLVLRFPPSVLWMRIYSRGALFGLQ